MNHQMILRAIEHWRTEESKLWGGREVNIPGLHRLANYLRKAFEASLVDEASKDAAVAKAIDGERRRAIADTADKLLADRKLRKAVSEAMAKAVRTMLNEKD